MFKRILDEYFAFNKQQRKGLFVLACICLLLLVVRLVYPSFIHPDAITVQNLPVLPMDTNAGDITSYKKKPSKLIPETFIDDLKPEVLFGFNPNTVSEADLIQLGFKKKTAKTFLKFRQRGFVFKRKEDLKKVYGVSDALYNSLEVYINIPNQNVYQPSTKKPRQKTDLDKAKFDQKIELNAADTALLMRIKLLDESLIKHLLKYRNKLGGFVNLSQLKEVFGFDEKRCQQLQNYLRIDQSLIRKINPNQSTLYSLKTHPYIGLETAEKIIHQRKTKLVLAKDIAEIMKDAEQLKKLMPYLEFD
ncbi:MAG: helix-hairpin-helix domain-containing protein [Bacteroidota bacterium]